MVLTARVIDRMPSVSEGLEFREINRENFRLVLARPLVHMLQNLAYRI